MGLKAGKNYTVKEITDGIKDATGAATVVVAFTSGAPNCKLTVDGHGVAGKHGASGAKVTWSKYLVTEVGKVAPTKAAESVFVTH
jgi:hypothetical protein